MKGKYHIIVENRKLRYEFDIKRNITIIRGDSATGKTTLIDMINQYQVYGEDSGINVVAECKLIVANNSDWEYRIKDNPGAIIFMDECNSVIATEEFAKTVKNADAYFVLVTRDKLENLPYSVEEIYGIRTSNKYAGLKQVYHEFYNLYGDWNDLLTSNNKHIITEDSNTGYEFFANICGSKIAVSSAEGKSNVHKAIRKSPKENILVIADGAAFGPEIEGNMELLRDGYNISFYLPESFEWIILNSNVLDDKEVTAILKNPENYIDSREYFSWERFFTELLVQKSKNTYLRYNKSSLSNNYLHGNVLDKILKSLPPLLNQLIKNS